MLRIKLLCVGKDKDKYIKTAISEYLKRLGKYSETELIYIADIPLSGTNNPEIIKAKEGERILKFLESNEKRFTKSQFIISLDASGISYDSESFSRLIKERGANSDILFIIGGVYGLAEEVKKRSDLLLSLSRLTFTHQMSRIIILEQIYRAFTILYGKKYHY